ncbi:deoxyribodipyrimidine photo-lyase [soil metagenome]
MNLEQYLILDTHILILNTVSIFWFRRDLRLHDNTALHHALQGEHPVLPIFIFDTNILDELPPNDARVEFIHHTITTLNEQLKSKGTNLLVKYGKPMEVWHELLKEYDVKALYANRDYEPYARERDKAVYELLESKGIPFKSYKDQVIFEKSEVVKENGEPYLVYTPYSKVWLAKLQDKDLASFPSALQSNNFYQQPWQTPITLQQVGFEPSGMEFPSVEVADGLLENYQQQRNYPAVPGTSKLGLHFRFGTVSIREKARQAKGKSATYLNELVWREFYQVILWHFPRVVKQSFRPEYDRIVWRNNDAEFKLWCQGQTGYPIVDAGMRELNATGFMHNRVRMIGASFLTKHLLIDWRWGEAYFAEKLLDYDLASNNGGWQWAAGTGVDAAPYFRVFNPTLQQAKFDPKGKYVRKWVPELGTAQYPAPMVDHAMARQRALDTYKKALKV